VQHRDGVGSLMPQHVARVVELGAREPLGARIAAQHRGRASWPRRWVPAGPPEPVQSSVDQRHSDSKSGNVRIAWSHKELRQSRAPSPGVGAHSRCPVLTFPRLPQKVRY
jgi:hypothetical protein